MESDYGVLPQGNLIDNWDSLTSWAAENWKNKLSSDHCSLALELLFTTFGGFEMLFCIMGMCLRNTNWNHSEASESKD